MTSHGIGSGYMMRWILGYGSRGQPQSGLTYTVGGWILGYGSKGRQHRGKMAFGVGLVVKGHTGLTYTGGRNGSRSWITKGNFVN